MPFFHADDGTRLYYESTGKGMPVILIHGLTASHKHFKKQIPELARHFHVIACDLRAHGQSEALDQGLTMKRLAADLKNLISHLELCEMALVGWSMGAHVIFEYIKNYSCMGIDRIAIIDMAPKLMKSNDWRCGLPGLISRRTGDFGHEDNLLLLAAMLENWENYSRIVVERIMNKSLLNNQMKFDSTVDFKGKEDLPWLYQEAKKNRATVIAAYWISLCTQDYRPMLGNITVPTLLAYGMESNYYPPENYEYLKSHIQGSIVVPFAGCGHALHLQDPEYFNRVIIEFLKGRLVEKRALMGLSTARGLVSSSGCGL